MALRRVEQLGRSVVCTKSQNGRNVGGQLSKDIKRIFGRAWIVNARECGSSSSQGDVTVAYQKGLPTVVTVAYQKGLPTVTLPLPSRQERCRFTLRPFTTTVGEFIENIKQEDKGIDRVSFYTTDRVRIAASTKIESLLHEDFHLVVNDVIYHVIAPPTESLSSPDVPGLSEVKTQVARLYESLQIDIHQLEQERKLLCQLEELKQKLEPLEKIEEKQELAMATQKRTVMLSWLGLGWMGVQFGILARLTWWEYSWDIMEPVTFFITYGTTIVMYAYFVLTRQEYYLSDVHDRQYLITFYKKARKEGLDVEIYNSLRKAVAETEDNLRRLRDPLQLHLPHKELKQEVESSQTNCSRENVTR
ncbi:calcium uniporter protein, mitochondrial-like [Tachypleus tridentatus]|uniref:calcium uniporter protein, mitochondrial-like n=1 Tax=Tachypleus tridentatus TaxID=6853 RepID=UPI003FD3E73A